MKTIYFILIVFSQTTLAQERYGLIGNDFGIVSIDSRDDLIEGVKYGNNGFTPLNINYYRFGVGNLFNASFSYNKITTHPATDRSRYVTFTAYELDIDYYKQILPVSETLALYLGLDNHTYFFLMQFQDTQDTYDLGAFNLGLRALLEFKKEHYQIISSIGLGVLKYGARADLSNLLGIREGLKFDLSTLEDYTDLDFNIRANVNLSKRFVLSPLYKLRYLTNNESKKLRILKQAWLVGLYYKL